MTTIDRYGVMGYPVSHSRSPVIHRLFALQTGQELQYELLQVAPDKLETAVRQFVSSDRARMLCSSFSVMMFGSSTYTAGGAAVSRWRWTHADGWFGCWRRWTPRRGRIFT